MQICPNCGQQGHLVSSEIYLVTHCGCFWDDDATGKKYHITTEPELTDEQKKYWGLGTDKDWPEFSAYDKSMTKNGLVTILKRIA